MAAQRERIEMVRAAQVDDRLVPLPASSTTPAVNEEDRRPLPEFKVVKPQPGALKKWDSASLSINNQDKPHTARVVVRRRKASIV